MSTVPKNLTDGRSLARNTLYSLVGQTVPIVASVIAIPLLIKALGTDRFGVLTLAWMVVSYFSLFDLGLGRALTQAVAERLGAAEHREIPALVWTSLLLMIGFGMVGAIALAAAAPTLVHRVVKVPLQLQPETLRTFYILAASIPVVIGTSALAGVLAAWQRFDLVNALRIPMGLFTFLAPIAVLPFSRSMDAIVLVLVVGRMAAFAAHLLLCLKAAPMLRSFALQGSVIHPLLRFGTWMTVTNVVGPVMMYMDRFFIGSIISVAAVAYYATPYEIVTKVQVIPQAVVTVMFPAFAAGFVQDRDRTARLFVRTTKNIFITVFPIIAVFVALAHVGLRAWLGTEFASNSTRVLQWLAVGILFNSLAQAPYTLLQGIRRPEVTAKLHLLELPVYVATLLWLTRSWGVEGAAIAWTLRAAIDAFVLFALAERQFPSHDEGHAVGWASGFSLAIGAVVLLPAGDLVRSWVAAALLLVFVVLAWSRLLASDEKKIVLDALWRRRNPARDEASVKAVAK
jgi:O-antigen/teichoic acid export membrane protein